MERFLLHWAEQTRVDFDIGDRLHQAIFSAAGLHCSWMLHSFGNRKK
jgi:hypothetical protein